MNTIEIIIHTQEHPDGVPVNFDPELTVQDAIRHINMGADEELLFIIEGEDQPCERRHSLHECHINHGCHVHVRHHLIHYKVDGERCETKLHRMTPVQIMDSAGVSPSDHYLIWLKGGKEQVSYKGRPNEHIHMHNCMEFITGSLGPTPVS